MELFCSFMNEIGNFMKIIFTYAMKVENQFKQVVAYMHKSVNGQLFNIMLFLMTVSLLFVCKQ